MKIHRTLTVRPSGAPAFTLIELLVVITIIGLLAALSIGAFTMATQTAARNRTTATLQAIVSALEVYKNNNGDYPKPKNTTHGLDVKGGAQMLYQAITGDGNDQIDLGASSEAQTNSRGSGGVNPKFTINGDFVPSRRTDGTWAPGKLNGTLVSAANEFYLIDGFGHPFQYDKAQPTVGANGAPPPTPTTVNPTYDLWSYGNTNSTESTDAGLSTKENPTATSIWIKNW
jgi:prepilin-type N-terminal cleavage/methylation domain-containing protein